MYIRKAEKRDIGKILDLLSQVLEIHAALRPDLFIPGTTKYTNDELSVMISDPNRHIYVAVDESETVVGYVFCEIKQQSNRNNLVPFQSIYIDDLCIDQNQRGHHVGKSLFEYVCTEAKKLGCYEISLNVWEGNDTARKFYEAMGFRPKSTTMEFIL